MRTFQLSSEFGSLSVVENLMVGLPSHPGERLHNALFRSRDWASTEESALERAWDLIREFEMVRVANLASGALSGGQRRLVELMRILMASPRVLILDEPLAGVARSIGEVFIAKLARLRDEGMTIILVEHELDVIQQLSDVAVVMARGRKIAEGPMSEVIELPAVRSAYVAG